MDVQNRLQTSSVAHKAYVDIPMTKLVNEKVHGKPVDAATVILVRECNGELETLLLCRGKSRTVMNNAWVFPGGKLDSIDIDQSNLTQQRLNTQAQALLNEPDLSTMTAGALFHCACRETHEETSVQLQPEDLQTWSRWITPNEPSMMKKRFDARFFVAAMPDDQTAIHDGSEATDSQWCTPANALQKYVENTLVLAPPQIMSLLALTNLNTIEKCLQHAIDTPAYTIQPMVIKTEQSRTLIYPGDKDHNDQYQQMPGPTRLVWIDNHFEPPGGFDQYLGS